MLKVGHVTEVEEVMSFFSSFSFAKALEIAPWSRDKQGKRHFLPFHRNYSAKPLSSPERKHPRHECHLGDGGGGDAGGYINPSKCTQARAGGRAPGGAGCAHQTAQTERGKCNRERRMVSEEEEVKVMEEGRMCRYILPLWLTDRQKDRLI